jgi:hypothetical protein
LDVSITITVDYNISHIELLLDNASPLYFSGSRTIFCLLILSTIHGFSPTPEKSWPELSTLCAVVFPFS